MHPLLFLLLVLLALPGCRRATPPPSEELGTPRLAAEALGQTGGVWFFTEAAAPWLEPQWAALGLSGDPVALRAEFANAVFDPKAWRQLDRKHRFTALLLVGDPATYRPLLDHLRQSPDWVLTHVDAQAITYRRAPSPAWSPTALEPLKARFANHPEAEQVTLRVQTAHRLLALEQRDTATALLEEALKIDPRSAPAWTGLALSNAAAGKWDRVLEQSQRALKEDKTYHPAQAVLAEAYFAHGKFNDALLLTRKLFERFPEDGATLRLHARIAHAANAHREEAQALEKIIALNEARRLPVGNWHIYLAQAYAASARPEDALATFETALKEPSLTEEERQFAEKAIERIRGRKPIF